MLYAVCCMLYADDAGVVSGSTYGLARLMAAIVEVFQVIRTDSTGDKTGSLLMRKTEN